jgi:hypothetical protein
VRAKETTMAAEAKVIEVEPGSELAELIDEAASMPVVLAKNGQRFRIVRVDDGEPPANYSPERVRRAFERSFGILKGLDTEALKAEIREQRQQDSKGRPAT